MRNRNTIVALALAALVMAQGCASIFGRAGVESREHVLMPAIEQSWVGVYADVASGVNDAQSDGDLTVESATELFAKMGEWNAELNSEEPQAATIVALRARDWDTFEFYAQRGIAARQAAGEIGPNVAGELQERVNQFGVALASLAGEPTDPD